MVSTYAGDDLKYIGAVHVAWLETALQIYGPDSLQDGFEIPTVAGERP